MRNQLDKITKYNVEVKAVNNFIFESKNKIK